MAVEMSQEILAITANINEVYGDNQLIFTGVMQYESIDFVCLHGE